jgi:hypothetical protein
VLTPEDQRRLQEEAAVSGLMKINKEIRRLSREMLRASLRTANSIRRELRRLSIHLSREKPRHYFDDP